MKAMSIVLRTSVSKHTFFRGGEPGARRQGLAGKGPLHFRQVVAVGRTFSLPHARPL